MNLIYHIDAFVPANVRMESWYEFLSTKYDLPLFDEIDFNTDLDHELVLVFIDILVATNMLGRGFSLAYFYDAGPFKIFRGFGSDFRKVLDVCQIDDDLVAVEMKLLLS